MNPTYPTGTTTGDTGTSNVTSTLGTTQDEFGQGTYSEGRTRKTGEALRTELSNLKSDLDDLLSRATGMTETELSREHARLMTKFSSVRSAARGMAAEANRQLNQGVEVTTDYVKQKPLQSVAVATGFGLLLGVLLKSR